MSYLRLWLNININPIVYPMILRHIPNALTLFRLGLIVPFLMYLYYQEYTHAFYTFIFNT